MTPWSMLSIHVDISFPFAELEESITSQRWHMEQKCFLPAAVLLPASSISTTTQWPQASQHRDQHLWRSLVKYLILSSSPQESSGNLSSVHILFLV